MRNEHFLSPTYISDPEDATRHQLVTTLCAFFDGREAVRWTPLTSAHLRVLVSELTGGNAKPQAEFERMYHVDLLKLPADKRRIGADLILKAIGWIRRLPSSSCGRAGGRACAAQLTTSAKRPSRVAQRKPDRVGNRRFSALNVFSALSSLHCSEVFLSSQGSYAIAAPSP